MNVCNLISLAVMTTAEISKGDYNAVEKAEVALNDKMLYGDVPKDIKDHLVSCLASHRSSCIQ